MPTFGTIKANKRRTLSYKIAPFRLALLAQTNLQISNLRHILNSRQEIGLLASFVFQGHPVSTVYAGPIFWEVKDARRLMQWYREFLPQALLELCPFSVPKACICCDQIRSSARWCTRSVLALLLRKKGKATTLRLRLKLENGHRSTIMF